MVGMTEVDWETCPLEPQRLERELAREVRQTFGTVPAHITYIAACPWVIRHMQLPQLTNGLLIHTDAILQRRIWLAISQDSSCRFCYAGQRTLLRLLGMPEDRLQHLEEELFTSELSDREQLAIEFARRVAQSNPPLSAEDKKPLRDAGFHEEEIKELAYVAAHVAGANRFSTLAALPPEPLERAPDSLRVRLLRPLIRRRLRSRQGLGQRELLSPELKTGPYSYLVLALDGIPVARSLRQMIDAALDSPVLSRRAKLLVFAVVARGMSSELSERETARLLAKEGLDREQLDEILAHLASPVLDPLESLIVPFARETIWYRTGPIQRKAAALAAEVTDSQFLELVAVAALANMLCRLAVILDVS